MRRVAGRIAPEAVRTRPGGAGGRALVVIVSLTGLAYLNSFAANPALDRLWPPWGPMFGGENPARPLPYFSFAAEGLAEKRDHATAGENRSAR